MKVRLNQIPEESSKPMYPDKKKMKTTTIPEKSGMIDLDDLIEDEEAEPDEEKFVRTMINFDDIGISMSLFGIESIEKDMLFVEKPKAHWEFGIMINKGIEPSIRFPKVNVGIWFISEELRDSKWASVMEKLRKESFKVIEM